MVSLKAYIRKLKIINIRAFTLGFPGGSESEGSACNAGDLGSKPGTLHQKQAEKSETIKAREKN